MVSLVDLEGRGVPHVVLRVRLLSADEGGRTTPVFTDYRPQLWLGQRLIDRAMIVWDCVWLTPEEGIRPGGEAEIVMCLSTLPFAAISKHERLEFFEGPTLIATGEVTRVWAPGHPHHEAGTR